MAETSGDPSEVIRSGRLEVTAIGHNGNSRTFLSLPVLPESVNFVIEDSLRSSSEATIAGNHRWDPASGKATKAKKASASFTSRGSLLHEIVKLKVVFSVCFMGSKVRMIRELIFEQGEFLTKEITV